MKTLQQFCGSAADLVLCKWYNTNRYCSLASSHSVGFVVVGEPIAVNSRL